MINKSVVSLIICCGFHILIQPLTPQALAMTREVADYEIGEQRTHRRPNHVEQTGFENELLENVEDVGPPFVTKLTETRISNEELPPFMIDYENMMRNIILLNSPVEARTHKRGNMKVEKRHEPHSKAPCNCEYNTVEIDLGKDYYPRFITNRNCSEQMCSHLHTCQSNKYELTILKRREPAQEPQINLPGGLRLRWVEVNMPITSACVCTMEFMGGKGQN